MSEADAPLSDAPLNMADVLTPKPQHFTTPDIVGTVEGWRAWQVPINLPRFGKPLLRSCVHDYAWKPRELSIAECSGKCGENIPGDNHGCGFYSAKTLEHLQTMSYHQYNPETGMVCVIGQVANWGKVIEGSLGWRAQKAYPVQLFIPWEAWKLATPLSETYGVPVKLANILSAEFKT